ncbi:hypothetical protein [Luteibacter sp. CQ10]|uniref:hypothetical protein n=1 Tax=Luteibacter sp. CQ10 TaxID=2805821 RepID=UPI0034A16123
MRSRHPWAWTAIRLDLVAGLVDGILTALTLGAGHLLPGAESMTLVLGLRVAIAAAISGAFIFLVAHYADLRGEFIEAERQLNMLSHGHLAASQLGKSAFREALAKAFAASCATFIGALLPVAISVAVPQWQPMPLVVALGALAGLGGWLAHTVHGRPVRWVVALVLVGALLAAVGASLHIA